ncbi:hypothetical protein HNR40_004486 [Nonomuraea endophytica]|uniref:Uncharacterized protein n=1 Tax=Nonomuraea endophytica TaxID=714136 RepID=A0A7W8EFP4_9ACTN|nr:hypothetical protein [Nonomuraea endophytica]
MRAFDEAGFEGTLRRDRVADGHGNAGHHALFTWIHRGYEASQAPGVPLRAEYPGAC